MESLIKKIFGSNSSSRQVLVTTPKSAARTPQGGAVYCAFVEGLDRMEREYVDRIILTMFESEPRPNPDAGKWVPFGQGSEYYPFETLTEDEQKMIKNGKTYEILSLVTEDVGGVISYPERGIETYHRTHGVPVFFPRVVPESNLNYRTEGGIYSGEKLRDFAENASNQGWTAEGIENTINFSVQEYHKVTERLMESAGVNRAIGRLDQRRNSALDEILLEMRNKIEVVKQ